MAQPIPAKCPNCGREHWRNKGNYYCDDCAARLKRQGLCDYIDGFGYLYKSKEIT